MESLTSKIKLLSKRKSFLPLPSSSSSSSKTTSSSTSTPTPTTMVDLFENEEEDLCWRWEILISDLLPSEILPNVKKARSARKKLSSHYAATTKLLQSLQDAESVILHHHNHNHNHQKKEEKQLLENTNITAVVAVCLAKISRDEEKVLKFEREDEKQRLAMLAKKQKEKEWEEKKREKERLAEEKRHQKERKKQEAETKKLEQEKKKQNAREEAKRKKEQEQTKKAQEKLQEEEQKNKKLNKQKACLLSFFAAPKKKISSAQDESTNESSSSSSLSTDQTSADATANVVCEAPDYSSADVFSKINSLDTTLAGCCPFGALSRDAMASRKRRTRRVPVSVYVTVVPDNDGWGAQPFAEQRVFHIPNKYQFLSFHEDCRPAYHGTWSKTSSIISGRNPFGKDPKDLDYEYDSEAEWEEGDDEVGEDVEDETKDKEEEEEEEANLKVYDYDDGFCVADDQYLDIDENVDEETKALYKKKLQTTGQNGDGQAPIVANKVSIIAPSFGGIPSDISNNTDLIEGFTKQEGIDLLSSHENVYLVEVDLRLDAFSPPLVNEGVVIAKNESAAPSGGKSANDEYSIEEMRFLARFAHHCTLNSKEKVVEELRNAHPSVFSSRAKATRKLDSIAVKKKRRNSTGVYWEVKKEILEELGLQDLVVSVYCAINL